MIFHVVLAFICISTSSTVSTSPQIIQAAFMVELQAVRRVSDLCTPRPIWAQRLIQVCKHLPMAWVPKVPAAVLPVLADMLILPDVSPMVRVFVIVHSWALERVVAHG